MSEHIRQFLDQILSGENAEAKETLENVLSAKAFDALDNHKKEIANSLFTDNQDQTETEEQIDSQEQQTEEQ